jgi:hypothetical protein
MPLTAAQRQANRRKKLKDDHNLYEDYKRKDALRKRLNRAGNKQKETELSVKKNVVEKREHVFPNTELQRKQEMEIQHRHTLHHSRVHNP